MTYVKAFNIVPPEKIKFRFRGKIGKPFATWAGGLWIITDKRLIFVAESLNSRTNPSEWVLRKVLIVLLEEIDVVTKKKKKIVVKFSPLDNLHRYTKFFIGFLNPESTFSSPYFINQIYLYLTSLDESPQFHCSICESLIDIKESCCLNCNTKYNRCRICNYIIVELDEQIQCPACKNYFHESEFFEWIKVYGQCPKCNLRLNELNLLKRNNVLEKFNIY